MKKAIILISAIAGLLSCAKEPVIPQEETGVPMTFNISVAETKAAKTTWANGDKIYVFFNGLATKYLILSYDGSVWSNTSGGGTLESTDFSGLGTKTLTAVHFPQGAGEVTVSYAASKFSFTIGGKPVYNYYLFEANKAYTVDGTTVNATLSMGKPANMVQIHVAGIQASIGDYTFGCSKIKPVACASVGTDGTITESVLQAGARLSGVADGDGGIFAGRLVYPGEAKNYVFTIASNDNIYTLTRVGKTLTAGKMYNFPALPVSTDANWTVTATSSLYVDMGTAGKWAKCNVGAEHDYDYGDYFAWGETSGYNEGKPYFNEENYAWGQYDALTKYCDVSSFGKGGYTDALTALLPEDDAAYAALGGKFRIPTKAEWTALQNDSNYTWEWTTDYSGTGIHGSIVTSKSDGSKSIFLPATGYRTGLDLSYLGTSGYYWSSSLQTGWPIAAHCVVIDGSSFGIFRYYGASVRPIYSE